MLLKNLESINVSFIETYIQYIQSFSKKYSDLHEKIQALLLTFEKYDFVIDPEQENIKSTLPLQSELLQICSQIVEPERVL